MKRKSSPKTAAAGDPLAELERKLDALALRVDELDVRPVGERVLAKQPALLGADPAGQLLDQWKSIRDRATSAASIAGQYLGRVIRTPFAGAALLSAVLALLQSSVAFVVIAVALSAAAVSTTAPAPSPEKSPLA